MLDPIGNRSVDEETLLQFTVTASDPDDVPANTRDAVGDGICRPGRRSTPATGVFAWTPSEAQQGQYVVTFTATDDGTPNLTDSEAVTITVGEVNDAPVLDPIGNRSVDEETLLQFTVTAGDPNDVPANARDAVGERVCRRERRSRRPRACSPGRRARRSRASTS